jgi:hypothetical protein
MGCMGQLIGTMGAGGARVGPWVTISTGGDAMLNSTSAQCISCCGPPPLGSRLTSAAPGLIVLTGAKRGK